ncbi:MAG: hypothetical protein E2598_10360 [Sphingobium sp.]|nr:hypothetical protein [Sphingobium sp.]
MISLSPRARHCWSVLSRTLAVTLGAYGVTSLATVALSLLLVRIGMDRVEAVTAATLASFAVFSVIAMMAFHARSPAYAWMWLIIASVPPGLMLVLMSGAVG